MVLSPDFKNVSIYKIPGECKGSPDTGEQWERQSGRGLECLEKSAPLALPPRVRGDRPWLGHLGGLCDCAGDEYWPALASPGC